MFNWYGNHKIGVLGAANSGKTILLTSLLWHLSHHNPDDFKLKNNVKICDFEPIKRDKNNFNFESHKNTFIFFKRWPDKTADFSIADCRYNREDRFCERHVKFVDIPGERVSDILLWKARSYSEWVTSLYDFWQKEHPCIKQIMAEYCQKASQVDTTVEQLNSEYKKAMWKMLDIYCPITPSTYYLGTDGHMLGDDDNRDREEAIKNRPVWDGGDLLPVPESWKKAHPDDYKIFEKNFKRYKRQVLKPLFDEIDDCDNFIFCVDILNILMAGPELYLQNQREFKDFIKHLAPGKLGRFLNRIGHNPPRLAVVAPKSDMILSTEKDKFDRLLDDFCKPFIPSSVNYKRFICSACVSTVEQSGQVIGRDQDNPQDHIVLTGLLPEYWPDQWKGEAFNYPEVAPEVSVGRPPTQINLNKLFEFIVEDVEM